jgi:ABC-type transport system involved in multi-copper enzyme maturation permease subunit
MFWKVLSIENTKIYRRKLFWVELVLMALMVLILQIAIDATVEASINGTAMTADDRLEVRQIITWPGALVNVLNLASGSALGGLLFVVLVGAITAQEYNWRTLHLWLSRGIPRPLLGTVKFTALLLPALLIVLTALVTGGAITGLLSAQIDGSLHLDRVNSLQLLYSAARTTYTLLPYGALTFLLAIASRSTVVAISVGLSYVLLLESALMQLLGLFGESLRSVTQYMPAALGNSLLVLNQATDLAASSLPVSSVSPLIAVLGIAAWTLLFLGLSLLIIQRQDLTA